VAGEQQGHQLVAQVCVAQPTSVVLCSLALITTGDLAHSLRTPSPAVLEARLHQHREDVVALFQAALGAALGDLGVEQVVDLFQPALEFGPRSSPEAARHQADQLREGRGGFLQHVGEQGAQALEPGSLGDAEDHAQDHLEGDRLHARMDGELLSQRPGVDLDVDDLLHDRLVGAHPLTVEGRQHQLAMGEVVGALQHQHPAGAEDRFEDDIAPRRQPVLALRVQGLDRSRVGDHHHRPLEAEKSDAEAISVPLSAILHEGQRAKRPAQSLDKRRAGRARGKRHEHRVADSGERVLSRGRGLRAVQLLRSRPLPHATRPSCRSIGHNAVR
jgi:hypothetical protein